MSGVCCVLAHYSAIVIMPETEDTVRAGRNIEEDWPSVKKRRGMQYGARSRGSEVAIEARDWIAVYAAAVGTAGIGRQVYTWRHKGRPRAMVKIEHYSVFARGTRPKDLPQR